MIILKEKKKPIQENNAITTTDLLTDSNYELFNGVTTIQASYMSTVIGTSLIRYNDNFPIGSPNKTLCYRDKAGKSKIVIEVINIKEIQAFPGSLTIKLRDSSYITLRKK